MSDFDEKTSIDKAATDSGRAKAWLKRSMTFKDGSPRYVVLKRDDVGPLLISMASPMGPPTYWRRVIKEKGDYLFEEIEDPSKLEN